jgi:predicted amidohydrolase YtcJ
VPSLPEKDLKLPDGRDRVVRHGDRKMRMVTIEAAFAHGVEDKVGSVDPGKYADFAVLDQDPMRSPRKNPRHQDLGHGARG